jgi:ubiquinone/menaquinone biosynthesis C-methylase UbiE
VGVYNDQILPRIINVACGSKSFGKVVRAEACEGLRGDVLEIGFGSGHNLEYLPPEVTGIWTVEPSDTAVKLGAKRIAASSVPVTLGSLDGQRLEFPDDRFDSALSTMTLCTIPDVDAALAEIRRVLKPGAYFHFAEHGHSPDAKVARAQDRYNGIEMKIAGGCHLNREIENLVVKAGFEIESLRNFYLKGNPKVVGYMYVGRARNP